MNIGFMYWTFGFSVEAESVCAFYERLYHYAQAGMGLSLRDTYMFYRI